MQEIAGPPFSLERSDLRLQRRSYTSEGVSTVRRARGRSCSQLVDTSWGPLSKTFEQYRRGVSIYGL